MTLDLKPKGDERAVEQAYKGTRMQVMIMSVPPNGIIPMEMHDGEQFIRVEAGTGTVYFDGSDDRLPLIAGDAVVITEQTHHEIIAGEHGLRFYTVYAPPAH